MVRLASGIVLAAVALAAILFLPITALRLLVCIVAALAGYEYLRIVQSPLRAIVLVVAMCWVSSAPEMPAAHLLLVIAFFWVAIEVLAADHSIQHATTGVFAAVYIGMPMGMLASIHALQGWRATVLLLATIIMSDSCQYYTGRMFGKRPLAPAISPKKTVEGAIGGAVCAILFMVLLGAEVFPAAGYTSLFMLGLLVVVLGICGDLFESRLKRVADLKDSSSLIPGHGGMLDRIDGLLFAIPPFFLFVRNIS